MRFPRTPCARCNAGQLSSIGFKKKWQLYSSIICRVPNVEVFTCSWYTCRLFDPPLTVLVLSWPSCYNSTNLTSISCGYQFSIKKKINPLSPSGCRFVSVSQLKGAVACLHWIPSACNRLVLIGFLVFLSALLRMSQTRFQFGSCDLRLIAFLFRVSAIRGDGGIVSLNHGLRSRRTDGRPSRVDRGPAADRVDAGGGDRRWEADGRSASGDGGRRVLPSRPRRWLGD